MNEAEITKLFKAYNYAISKSAVKVLLEYLEDCDDKNQLIKEIIDTILKTNSDEQFIDKGIIIETISNINRSKSPTYHVFDFQNAFDAPLYEFDNSKRMLVLNEKPRSIYGEAKSKSKLYSNRYDIVKACLLQSHLFAASTVNFSLGSESLSITPISSLISKVDESVIILGIMDLKDDKIVIHDDSRSVAIDVSNVKLTPGIYSIGSIALIQGLYTDDEVVQVSLIGYPPATSYDLFIKSFWNYSTDPFGWGLTDKVIKELQVKLEEEHHSSLILVFSDVWIDIPKCVDNFSFILSQYDRSPPNIIILCGSFISYHFSFDHFDKFKRLFEKFHDMLKKHSSIYENTKFIFVPSLSDPAVPKVFPRHPLPKSVVNCFPEGIFLTNPCKFRFFSKTIQIFRDDLISRLTNSAILPVQDFEEIESLLYTIFNQKHLCPIDLKHCPINWEYDHSFRLFPPPDVLILADSSAPWERIILNTIVFNPGQFGNNGSFALYYPAEGKVKLKTI